MGRLRRRLYSWDAALRCARQGEFPGLGLIPLFGTSPESVSDLFPTSLPWYLPCKAVKRYLGLLDEGPSQEAVLSLRDALEAPVAVWRTAECERVGLLLDELSGAGLPLTAYVALDGRACVPTGDVPCVFVVGIKELEDVDATLTWAIRNDRVMRLDLGGLRGLLRDCDIPAPVALTALGGRGARLAQRRAS